MPEASCFSVCFMDQRSRAAPGARPLYDGNLFRFVLITWEACFERSERALCCCLILHLQNPGHWDAGSAWFFGGILDMEQWSRTDGELCFSGIFG
jgi:hypothetical protein